MPDYYKFLKRVFEMAYDKDSIYDRDSDQISSLILDDGRFYISSELVTDDDGFMHFIVSDREEELRDRNVQLKISEI